MRGDPRGQGFGIAGFKGVGVYPRIRSRLEDREPRLCHRATLPERRVEPANHSV